MVNIPWSKEKLFIANTKLMVENKQLKEEIKFLSESNLTKELMKEQQRSATLRIENKALKNVNNDLYEENFILKNRLKID
ncbi:hypothetical protein [Bacillus sp. ISL-57]|uniref:hypothetical protein n=1 Tax=Bacillus sp. ISL-57 TaxID=2819135 RepID=UPI001BE6DC87|nr:hypothetical protein [Bacillus sp. ISL-57]MBT2718066.1 hypothetical protein [Bacillus sp. ISL-57]